MISSLKPFMGKIKSSFKYLGIGRSLKSNTLWSRDNLFFLSVEIEIIEMAP